MLENRDYMRQPTSRFRWTATTVLLAINIIVFVLDKYVLSRLFPYFVENHLALSLGGLRHGYVWQLFTYQFLHGGWFHLLANCWALFIFGRAVEFTIGTSRFLVLYFVSGIVGGLFQEFAALVWPFYFGSAVVGASAGIFGVVAAFSMLFPDRVLTLLLFLVVPLNLRAKYLLLISLLLAALGIASPQFHSPLLNELVGAHVAHAAHMGGILAGMACIRWLGEPHHAADFP